MILIKPERFNIYSLVFHFIVAERSRETIPIVVIYALKDGLNTNNDKKIRIKTSIFEKVFQIIKLMMKFILIKPIHNRLI